MIASKKKLCHKRARLSGVAAFIFAGLLFTLSQGASAASSALTWSEDHKLNNWVGKDLTPYLAETLSRHPRFKGQPLRFVSIEGEKIRPDMDDLTRDMIRQLRHSLQKTPGINLVWQGNKRDDVPCHKINEPEYHIAIEIVALGNHRYRIAVRALDIRERSWVAGFGREWQGTLNRAQRIALGRRDGGGALLGLRDYPYSEAQTDLLAQDLAQSLKRDFCGFVGEPLVVHTQRTPEEPAVVGKTLDLVGNYLSRSGDVTVTDDAGDANVLVSAKMVRIDEGLHQFWIVVRPAHRDLALPDLDTQAYLRLTESPAVRLVDQAPATGAPSTAQTPPVHRVRSHDLLSSVAVVTPRDPRNCRSANPWRFGAGVASAGNRVRHDGCFAIEMRSNRDARVFLINLDRDAGLVRLLPSSCRTFGRIRTAVARGETVRFPSADKGTYHVLKGPGRTGSETFYAIAVSDRRAADRIDEHVAKLSDACNASRRNAYSSARLAAWERAIRKTVDELGSRAQWQRLQVNYVAHADTLASRD